MKNRPFLPWSEADFSYRVDACGASAVYTFVMLFHFLLVVESEVDQGHD